MNPIAEQRAEISRRLGKLSFMKLSARGFRVTHRYEDGTYRMAKNSPHLASGSVFIFMWGGYACSPILTYEEICRQFERDGIKGRIGEAQSL